MRLIGFQPAKAGTTNAGCLAESRKVVWPFLAGLPSRLVHVDHGRMGDQVTEGLEFRFPMPANGRKSASASDFFSGSPQKNPSTAQAA
jgi:hypothetical protein